MKKTSYNSGNGQCLYLIFLFNINWTDFLDNPVINRLRESGTIFHFQEFLPLEPRTAFTYISTGCNPGRVGFLNKNDDLLQFRVSEGFNKTILSLLSEKGFSVEYLANNLPTKGADFSFIYLNNFQLLEKILNLAQKNSAYIFLIAPIFEEYVEKAININNFLREKQIIETNAEGQVVWKNSLAYQKEYGQIWINLIGREPQGAVSPGEEYNEVREALIKGITEKLIDNESGQPVVERIYKKEDLFNGKYLFKMPDLIVTLKQGYGFSNFYNESIFNESAVCRKKIMAYTAGTGIIIGKNIRKGLECKDLAITSIVPSILYCIGSTIPSWMDGRVEEQIFNEDFISVSPPKYDHDEGSAVLSEQDEDLIKDRLRGLGYL